MATSNRLCAFCGSPLVIVGALGEKDKGFGLCASCAAEIERQIPGLTLVREEPAEEQAEEEAAGEQQ